MLHQVAQDLVLLSCENLQRWRFQSLSGPLFQCSAVLLVWSHKRQIERRDHFHKPAGYILANTAQDEAVQLCWQTTMLTHIQLVGPHALFLKTAFDPVGLQPLLMRRVTLSQAAGINFYQVHLFSLPRPLRVAVQLPSVSKAARNVVLSADLLRMHSTPRPGC